MSDSLAVLEQKRLSIIQQIVALGDLRPGSITPTKGRCGKLTCHCHRPGDPGHGPNIRLTYKLAGKTVTESLPTPATVAKAQREINEFRNFDRLQHDFLAVNAQICRLRPVENALSPEEKKRPKSSSRRSPTK